LRIAIASGKGGTGKTTFAAGLAYALAEDSLSVAYLDCDVEAPNGHVFIKPEIAARYRVVMPVPSVDKSKCNFCGECSRACQYNAIAVLVDEVLVYPTLCHGCGACRIICPENAIVEQKHGLGYINSGAGYGITFWEGRLDVGQSLAPPITKALKKLYAEQDVTIVDAPPGSSCPVIEALGGCDYVVMVTEPTPLGLHDLELAHGVTKAMGIPCGVIVNRSDIGDQRVDEYCRRERLTVLKRVPHDRRIAETYARADLPGLVEGKLLGDLRELHQAVVKDMDDQRTGRSQR
jgi:MinD superfamily P-loop ATPase